MLMRPLAPGDILSDASQRPASTGPDHTQAVRLAPASTSRHLSGVGLSASRPLGRAPQARAPVSRQADAQTYVCR